MLEPIQYLGLFIAGFIVASAISVAGGYLLSRIIEAIKF